MAALQELAAPIHSGPTTLQKTVLQLQPHKWYESAADISEVQGMPGSPGLLAPRFWRTKIRCSAIAEWMALQDIETGRVLWRIEARYGDRDTILLGGKGQKDEFITAVRIYQGTDHRPRFVLVWRSDSPGGVKSGGKIEVFVISPDQPVPESAAADASFAPNVATEMFPGGPPSSGPAQSTPSEMFTFMPPQQQAGEVFAMYINDAVSGILLTSELVSPDKPPTPLRTLALMKRSLANEPGTVEVDGALDTSLVLALLVGAEQLLLKHDTLDYDIDWPPDYYSQATDCCTTRRHDDRRMRDAQTQSGWDSTAPEKTDRTCSFF